MPTPPTDPALRLGFAQDRPEVPSVSPQPWLVPAALLFWGLLTGLWWLAVPLAGLALLPELTGWRFALALAVALAAGLRWSHDASERVVMRWIEHWMGATLDPYRSTTAIGEVGRL